MPDLLAETRRMSNRSIAFARGVSQVWTPDHLVPLRDQVRKDHRGDLLRVHHEINLRFGTTGATTDFVNVFYAASEMALMAEVGGDDLSDEDRQTLRRLWNDLLAA